jgi:hypothetical protein
MKPLAQCIWGRYTLAWKGSLTTMINWYRAIRVSREFKDNIKAPKPVFLPLLLLWEKQDLSLDFLANCLLFPMRHTGCNTKKARK